MINNKQRKTITIEQKIQIPSELKHLRNTALENKNKLCVIVYSSDTYVSYINNVISKIQDIMGVYNIDAKILPEVVKPQKSNFDTILQMVKDCVLGIVILDGLRPNVMMEYGMLLGLEKPIIVLKDKNAKININGLSDTLKTKCEKHHISNPKLDVTKHISNVNNLNYTGYDCNNLDKFEEILKENLTKLKDDIILQITKPMMPSNLNPDEFKHLQEKFIKIAEYSIKFIKPDFESINKIDKEINDLVNQYHIELPATYYFEIGNIYYKLSKYDEALMFFNKAIEINPDDAEAWYNKGVVLGELNRPDEELKAYNKAIEIKPDDAEAWYNKGVVLGKLNRPDEALKAYDKAIEIKPDYAEAWYNKGVVLGKLNRPDEALKAYDKAIE
ncbi:MAG: tetratricopeptide repeat protein, partial [Methanosarcinales archaeon]|nr:tetratricopeptide repeat protein [Methanosarcinales archaeon]